MSWLAAPFIMIASALDRFRKFARAERGPIASSDPCAVRVSCGIGRNYWGRGRSIVKWFCPDCVFTEWRGKHCKPSCPKGREQ